MKTALAALLVAMLSGCMTSTTYKYGPDGKMTEKTIRQSPLIGKAIDINAKAVGLEATMFDPNSGAYSPCIKILYGKAGTRTLPVADDGRALDTYSETLTVDTSWWGAEISAIDYTRTAGGQLKNVEPAVKVNLNIDKGPENDSDKNGK